jgi:hypothetical protein
VWRALTSLLPKRVQSVRMYSSAPANQPGGDHCRTHKPQGILHVAHQLSCSSLLYLKTETQASSHTCKYPVPPGNWTTVKIAFFLLGTHAGTKPVGIFPNPTEMGVCCGVSSGGILPDLTGLPSSNTTPARATPDHTLVLRAGKSTVNAEQSSGRQKRRQPTCHRNFLK